MKILLYVSLLLGIFSNPILCCKANDYRLNLAPKMTPVLVNDNELMVWVDYQPSLDAFFEDLEQDLSTNKSIESYSYKNFSIVDAIAIGPKGSFGNSSAPNMTSQAFKKEVMKEDMFVPEVDQPVKWNETNILQPLVEESRILANFNPCEDYKNASLVLMPNKEQFDKGLPWLILVFDTFADESCQDGTIPKEQIDNRIDLQECFALEEKVEDGPPIRKLDCGSGNGQKRNEMNIFMLMLMPSILIVKLL